MRVFTHLDPLRLEEALLDAVGEAHGRRPGARTLILAPTTRLCAHIERRLAERRGAWLGVDVLQFRAVAARILAAGDAPAPRRLSPRLFRALVHEAARSRPKNAWSLFLDRRPGTLRNLAEAAQDLREAGVTSGELLHDCGEDRAFAELYRELEERLEALARRGHRDEAGWLAAAIPGATTWARAYGAIFLHGAYELIGSHLALARALDRGTPVTAFVPGAVAPAGAVAISFARTFLTDGAAPRALADPLPIEERPALVALYDEECLPEPCGRFGFRHAQGEAAEVTAAVTAALAAVRAGCPPSEIAIVGRTLAPYAAAIEATLDGAGIPWTSSLGGPLRRQPLVRDFLELLRVVGNDFPRGATAAILRSPRIEWRAVLPDGRAPDGTWADRASRRARIVGGLDEWTDHLAAWVHETEARPRPEEAPEETADRVDRLDRRAARVGHALGGLRDLVDPAPRRWAEHAARLGRLFHTVFVVGASAGERAAALLDESIDELGRFETVLGDVRPVPFDEAIEALEEAVDGSELPLRPDDDGGLRILDLMQARGLTFRRVHVVGLNAGLFPRPAREDSVLGDTLRHRIAERTGKPLATKRGRGGEERLLLALALGCASERVDLSWQRADESGRARTPSLALREVARVVFGRPDLDRLRAAADHIPSHPAQCLETALDSPGLLSPADECLLAALHSGGADAAREVLGDRPELEAGLRMLRATQSFGILDPAYDASVGPLPLRPVSASALEKLGRCPLQFFFSQVLRVRELESAADPLDLRPDEVGTQVHTLLERIYRTLAAEGHFDRGNVDASRERAFELIDEGRGTILGALDNKLRRRFPLLWDRTTERWAATLRLFVARDLSALLGDGLRPEGFELAAEAPLDLGEGVTVTVRSRFDRVFGNADRRLVGDYKASKNLADRVNVTEMLKGNALQAPLYAMLAGAGATVEMLGIHPDLDYADDEWRKRFTGFARDAGPGFLETLRALVGLAAQGEFPLAPSRRCIYCPYDRACRRTHPPTAERQAESPAGRTLAALRKKSSQKPRLSDQETGR